MTTHFMEFLDYNAMASVNVCERFLQHIKIQKYIFIHRHISEQAKINTR